MNIIKITRNIIDLSTQLLQILSYLFLACILIAGSVASIFILFTISEIFIFILRFLIVIVVVSLVSLACFGGVKMFKKSKQQRIKKRERFLDDLAVKLEERGVGVVKTKKKK